MGKGSHYRPIEDRKAFDESFERIFGKRSDVLEVLNEPPFDAQHEWEVIDYEAGQKPAQEGAEAEI